MSHIDKEFNAFSARKSWKDKRHAADAIWAQVEAALDEQQLSPLPQTLRRPDVRLIVNNCGDTDAIFINPGDHTAGKEERIPVAGESTAAMIMLQGPTLDQQRANAEYLYVKYALGQKGLSPEFVADLRAGVLADRVQEAYGPAPFAGQAGKLSDLLWTESDGVTVSTVSAVKGGQAAYGARPAAPETVFLARFDILVNGTNTTPEMVESDGICVAVTKDWQSNVVTTRPIVPSVARAFYGEHFSKIPVAYLSPDEGKLQALDLKNGTAIILDDEPASRRSAPQGAQPLPRQ